MNDHPYRHHEPPTPQPLPRQPGAFVPENEDEAAYQARCQLARDDLSHYLTRTTLGLNERPDISRDELHGVIETVLRKGVTDAPSYVVIHFSSDGAQRGDYDPLTKQTSNLSPLRDWTEGLHVYMQHVVDLAFFRLFESQRALKEKLQRASVILDGSDVTTPSSPR